MTKNLGMIDRALRAAGAVALGIAAFSVPAQAAVRLGLAGLGGYLLLTALAGTCLGYRLMGRSTCPTTPR